MRPREVKWLAQSYTELGSKPGQSGSKEQILTKQNITTSNQESHNQELWLKSKANLTL